MIFQFLEISFRVDTKINMKIFSSIKRLILSWVVIIRRYCVIIYVSHFWHPNFFPIYIWSLIYTPNCLVLCQYISSLFHCTGNVRGRVPVDCLQSVSNDATCTMYGRGGGGQGHVGGNNVCLNVRAKLFWHTIYCAKLRPNHMSQSGSQSKRGMGRRALHIMQD